eukprot:3285940-Pyramimonas_sp.AAC.1
MKFWRWRSRRSASPIVSASSMAAARSDTFHGLTKMAPAPRLCAAPANSDSTSTPAFLDWHATTSYDTCRAQQKKPSIVCCSCLKVNR